MKEKLLQPFEYQKMMNHNSYQDYIKDGPLTYQKNNYAYEEKQKDFIRERVTHLPSGELAIIYLKFWEGLDESKISKTLAMHILKVKKLLSSAILRLKEDFAVEHKAFLAKKESLCA